MTDKVILVFDKPKTCLDCPVCTLDEMDGDYICSKTRGCVEEYFDKKPSWCPLRPLPQKNKYDVEKYATVDYENAVTLGHYLNMGWNDCIDEITGEE